MDIEENSLTDRGPPTPKKRKTLDTTRKKPRPVELRLIPPPTNICTQSLGAPLFQGEPRPIGELDIAKDVELVDFDLLEFS